MASSVTVKVEGLKEIGDAMRDLGFEVQDKVSRQATRAAANLIRDAARAHAPMLKESTPYRTRGALREAIGVRRDKKNSYPGFEVMAVGVFKISGKGFAGGKGDQSPAFYWKFVEFGTVKMQPQSFLRKGYDEDKSSAYEKMANALSTGIDKAVKKAGGR